MKRGTVRGRRGCSGQVPAQTSEVWRDFGSLTARRWVLSLAVLLTLVLTAGQAWADGPYRAGLVVRFDDDRIHTACVTFSEDSLTGLELLERSGLRVRRGFGGGAVCRIQDLGCEGDNCFCQCTGADCRYWAYFRLGPDAAWKYAQVGAGDVVVRDGDVEGWSWGPGATVPPPAMSLGEICGLRGTITPSPAAVIRSSAPPSGSAAGGGLPLTPLPVAPTPPQSDAPARDQSHPAGGMSEGASESPAGVPAGYGLFALVVVGLVGVLVALRSGWAARR